MKNRMCAVCQFCTYEESCKDMVCHNEVAEMFGEALTRKDMYAEDCEYFSPHVYNTIYVDGKLMDGSKAVVKTFSPMTGEYIIGGFYEVRDE